MTMQIQHCPHCGSKTSPHVLSSYNDELMPTETEDPEHNELEHWFVICDARRGGCGAAGGHTMNGIEAAIDKWNPICTQ